MIMSIFAYFDSDFECVFKADSSDHIQEDVLLQYDKNDVLCSVVFFSWKLNTAELNYKIYNKKLLVIIWCFKQWQSEFKEFMFSVKILINHKNLQYFVIMKQLTHWQIQWAEYLSWFDFKITYQSDKQD